MIFLGCASKAVHTNRKDLNVTNFQREKKNMTNKLENRRDTFLIPKVLSLGRFLFFSFFTTIYCMSLELLHMTQQ